MLLSCCDVVVMMFVRRVLAGELQWQTLAGTRENQLTVLPLSFLADFSQRHGGPKPTCGAGGNTAFRRRAIKLLVGYVSINVNSAAVALKNVVSDADMVRFPDDF